MIELHKSEQNASPLETWHLEEFFKLQRTDQKLKTSEKNVMDYSTFSFS